jgi:hypothetical protein
MKIEKTVRIGVKTLPIHETELGHVYFLEAVLRIRDVYVYVADTDPSFFPSRIQGEKKISASKKSSIRIRILIFLESSVADPYPPDPRVFGPPGSGSISQRYGS